MTIDTFTASPLTVASGGTASLAWATSNATKITITAAPGGEVVSSTDASGTATSGALTAETVFTLTADGEGGPITRRVTVSVTTNTNMPTVTSFTATPATIAPGQSATLSWVTANADSVTITAGGATIVDAGGATGQQMVMPVDTTEYTLVATGAGGTAMSTVTVTVSTDPAIVSFMARPNTIDPGDASTLSWEVVNADNVTITDADGNTVYDDTGLMASVMVTPDVTTLYTLVATNTDGTAMMTAMVTVNAPTGPQITSFDAAPTTVNLGQAVTLSWAVTDATMITISDGAGTTTTSAALTGSVTVRPIVTTSYTLTASDGANPDATAMVTVMVNAASPAILDFSATPNPGPLNGNTTIGFDVVGADTVRVLRGNTEVYSGTLGTDTLTAALTVTSTTYTLAATNAVGTSMQMLVVTAQGAPTVQSLTVTPQSFQGTTTATLTYDVLGASSLALYVAGALDTAFTGAFTGTTAMDVTGSYAVSISATTEFRLVATSAGGTDEVIVSSSQVVGKTEPNDTIATAFPFPLNGSAVSGEISTNADVDVYAITVLDGFSIRAETSDGMGACALDTILTLTSTDGATELAFDDESGATIPGGFFGCSLIDPRLQSGAADLPAGTYYLTVESYDNTSSGAYVLTVDLIAPACGNGIINGNEFCDDENSATGDGCDASCQLEIAAVYTAPGAPMTYTATIAPAGIFYSYEITVTAETYLSAETFSNAAAGTCTVDTLIFLLDSTGAVIASDDLDGVASCSALVPGRDAQVRLMPGTYFLAVTEDGNNAEAYFELVLEGRMVDVCGNGVVDGADQCDDGNTTPGDGCSATCQVEAVGTFTATAGATQTFAGNALAIGQVDTFQVVVPPGDGVYLTMETFEDATAMTCTVDTLVDLLDASGTRIGGDDDDGEGACSLFGPSDAFARLAGGATYFVTVEEFGQNAAIDYDVVFAATAVDVCGNGVVETGEACDDGNTVGGDACPATCTFAVSITNSASPALAIPDDDPAGVTTTLALPATPICTVASIQVDVDITHTYRGDIELFLTSPAGTTVQLKGSAFDGAANIIGQYPTTLTPFAPLSGFNGNNANGTWSLFIEDVFTGDVGTLNSWGVTVFCQ